MSANQPVDPEEIAELIGRCKLAMSVSEFHGALVGYISAGGSFPHGSVLQALELEPDQPPTKDEQDMLTRLRHQTEEWLADPELTFSPWLPDDDAPIHERAEGLSEWAEGFLGGFGLGGSPGANKNMSDEARELLTDMDGIARTEFEFDKDDDVNDENLTEIEEYVRTGALLLHAEFSRIPRPASDTLH